MAKEGSVAPQERVNITYKPSTGDAQAEVELPLKSLFIGDYTGRPDERPLEDRKPINIDKDNFQSVLAEHNLQLQINVRNTLIQGADAPEGSAPGELAVNLQFKRLSDFGPEAVAERVPELRQLLELRRALTALKGPLGNSAAFRKKIQALIGDTGQRNKLLVELGITGKDQA